jgi:hypothetical protein
MGERRGAESCQYDEKHEGGVMVWGRGDLRAPRNRASTEASSTHSASRASVTHTARLGSAMLLAAPPGQAPLD